MKQYFYYSGARLLVPAGSYAILVTLVAWLVFTALLMVLPLSKARSAHSVSANRILYTPHIKAALILSLLGLAYQVLQGGFLFFLEDREEQAYDYFVLIWRWVVVIGFTASLFVDRKAWKISFLSIILIIFLRGDRTIFAIASAIYFVIAFDGNLTPQRVSALLSRPRYIAAAVLIPLVVLFGKPIYLAAKGGSFEPFRTALSYQTLEDFAFSIEPFVTFDHIDAVHDLNIHIPLWEFLVSVLGNFLVVPSAFGIETNLYNLTITDRLPQEVSYGIAGNYWAHAVSVGGIAMVTLFAMIYAVTLVLLDRLYLNRRGVARLGLAVIAATTAVYIHRNGLDNFLSFVRQILIAWLAVHLLSVLFRFSESSSPAPLPPRLHDDTPAEHLYPDIRTAGENSSIG